MADVFISYARENRDQASVLADLISSQGYNVWWDRELIAGDSYADVIEDTLDEAKAVIVLWSGVSRKSHWVRDEAAVGRDRNRLLPILVDDVLPPLGFRQVHTLDMKTWAGEPSHPEFEDLWAGLQALCGAPVAAAPPQQEPAMSAPQPADPPPRDAAQSQSSINWQAPEWLAKPNDKPIEKILKEEKKQRSFLRTFWMTSFVVSAATSAFFAVLAPGSDTFYSVDSAEALGQIIGAFLITGFGLVIGRFFVVIGRRLSKRKSTIYFDMPTNICLAISLGVSVFGGVSAVVTDGGNAADGLLAVPLMAAMMFPFFAFFSIPIGLFKGFGRKGFGKQAEPA